MTATISAEWTDVGAPRMPEHARERFLAVAEQSRWQEPEGSFPLSPGMSLELVIREFGIRPVIAVSYSEGWEAHDTTGEPGRFGDYTCTYQVLGVRTRKQRIYFLDGGTEVTPVLIVTDLNENLSSVVPAAAELKQGGQS